MSRALALAVAAAVAAAVAGYAWYRTLAFDRPTGPRGVAWYDAAGHRVDTARIGGELGSELLNKPIILGNRLIVETSGPDEGRGGPGGFAWIEPDIGQARIAWPITSKYGAEIEGAAVRDASTFALALDSADDSPDGARDLLEIGIAGRDAWLRPPVPIAAWNDRGPGHGRPLLLGLAWVGGQLQAAVTHPGSSELDEFGTLSPVDIVTVGASGHPQVRSMPLGCDCNVIGALPGATAWSLVVSDSTSGHVLIVDPSGARTPAPQLDDLVMRGTDRVALGTLWADSGWGENRIARDGSVSQPTPAVPGWKPLAAYWRMVWTGGELQRQELWSPDGRLGVIAQRVGDRTILTSSQHEDLQLIGDRPDRLRPTIYQSLSDGFEIGVFLPRASGGYYWVDGNGDYITLDAQLRRTDRLSLREHLRRRGSVGAFIDEPAHVVQLALALFGLPVLVLVGLVAGVRRGSLRTGPLLAALVLYVIVGGIALVKVLPLL